MTAPCRHRPLYGGADPDLGCYRSNMAAMERRLLGRSFSVRCGLILNWFRAKGEIQSGRHRVSATH